MLKKKQQKRRNSDEENCREARSWKSGVNDTRKQTLKGGEFKKRCDKEFDR